MNNRHTEGVRTRTPGRLSWNGGDDKPKFDGQHYRLVVFGCLRAGEFFTDRFSSFPQAHPINFLFAISRRRRAGGHSELSIHIRLGVQGAPGRISLPPARPHAIRTREIGGGASSASTFRVSEEITADYYEVLQVSASAEPETMLLLFRVMHFERGDEIVRKFPPKKGGA